MRMPCSSSAGRRSSLQAAGLAPAALAHDAADLVERLARRAPVLQRRLDARVDLVVQAGDAHHEELVEVVRRDRGELQALEQRDVGVLGELEHALVELQPRQLAVEVQLGIGEVDGLVGRPPAAVRRCSRAPMLARTSSATRARAGCPRAARRGRSAAAGRARATPRRARSAPRASGSRARGRSRSGARPPRWRRPRARASRAAATPGRAPRRRAAAATPRCRRPRPRRRPAGSVEALEHAEGVLAHRVQLGDRRRVRAPVGVGQQARADAEGLRPRRALAHACRSRAPSSRRRRRPRRRVPSSGWPSVRVAPRKASRASSLPSRISTSTPPSSRIAAANSSWLAAAADRRRGHDAHRVRAELLDQAALLGHHAGDLVDLLARDLAALEALAQPGEGPPLEHLAQAAVLDVGDQHARGVGADVDAGAEHSLGERLP